MNSKILMIVGEFLGSMETDINAVKSKMNHLYMKPKAFGRINDYRSKYVFKYKSTSEEEIDSMELARATKEEKELQIANLRKFQEKHKDEADAALERLKTVARENGNIFRELMETVKVASLGQITEAL